MGKFCPARGDEMQSLVRSFDWSRTAFGPMSSWPPDVTTLVDLVLRAPLPMSLWWGEDLIQLYNDAYRAVLVDRHPGALGAGAAQTWAAAWDKIGPKVMWASTTGVATSTDDLCLEIPRGRERVASYWTASYTPLVSRDTVSGLVVMLQATTAAHELEQVRKRLESERAAIANVFSQAPVAVATFRGDDLVCESANKAYLTAVGGRDIVGKPILEIVPELEEGFGALLREVMQTGVPLVGRDARLQGLGQDTYWTFLYAPLRGAGDRVEGVIAICTDVTEQVEARKRLQSLAEAAESANRTKDEFLAMLGHELRNPLSPIVTALELMRLRRGPSREQEIIERQVRHLTRLVDDLLDVSRITRGKIELMPQEIELVDVVHRAIELVSPLLEQQRDQLQVDIPRVGMAINADPARMAQVFANLLTNAAKYSPSGSRIAISTERIGDKVLVHVQDQGVGIEPEMLGKVFDMFFQRRQTPDRSGGGLGLGLAIAKSLVELHRGVVSAASEGRGKGSTFTVGLPLLAEDRLPAKRPETARPPRRRIEGHRTRILVVDDNGDAAEMLRQALRRLDYEVDVAHDGPAAIEHARAFHPEVALVDIGLPVMDGYEVARRLGQARKRREELHLIALTGYGQQGDRERSAAAGFERHLVKPVDLAELDTILQDCVHGSGAVRRKGSFGGETA